MLSFIHSTPELSQVIDVAHQAVACLQLWL